MSGKHGMEAYLEAIFVLHGEGVTVFPSILADHMGVARPTVTQTVQRMTAAGLVQSQPDKAIELTADGMTRAEAVVRKHRLLERWLTDELGLDWAEAHVEAGRLEHNVSPLVEERLFERLGHPTTCPHGNVIPGSGAVLPVGKPLSELHAAEQAEVIRIIEQAEEDLELLRFLHRNGLVPGNHVTVIREPGPYEAGIEVQVAGQNVVLDEQVAARVIVHPIA
jgi:DtxR family transcriptional regulator, Mn-dependent transcriptional regulator